MIEIKSRYGGKVLYTAESAADVREALVEAVKGGANLGGANLGGADLGGADLGGAYLRGAYLRGADLRDADLRDADLGGAYQGGADLRDADLGEGVWEKVASKLDEALQAMNDSGRHWIKGSLTRKLEDGSQAYCSVGSIEYACDDRTVKAAALWLLGMVCAGPVESFNDYEGTSWEDVQAVFGLAVTHARRFAALQPHTEKEAVGA